jgi:hypothetical protein
MIESGPEKSKHVNQLLNSHVIKRNDFIGRERMAEEGEKKKRTSNR